MTGSIVYQTCATGRTRIKALRIDGVEQSAADWSRESGIPATTILERLKSMTVKDAVFKDAPRQITVANLWPVPKNILAAEQSRWR